MIKKKIAAVLVIGMMFSANVFASPVELSVQNSGSFVIVKGRAEAGGWIAATAVRKGSDQGENGNIYAVKEEPCDDDGSFTFVFKMPDIRGGKATDGTYTVYVRCGESIQQADYHYVTSDIRKEVLVKAVELGENNPEELFSPESSYRIPLEVIGLSFERYDGAEESVQKEIQMLFSKNFQKQEMTEESLCRDFNYAQMLGFINVGTQEEVQFALKQLNPDFEGVVYTEITDARLKTFLVQSMDKGKPYLQFEMFDRQYAIANILNQFNQSRFSNMENLLKKYAVNLEIKETLPYKKYLEMKDVKRKKVDEEITCRLSDTPVYTLEEFQKVFQTSVDAVKLSDSSGCGGTGGSGSGISGGGSTASGSAGNVNSGNTIYTPVLPNEDLTNGKLVFSDLNDAPWAEEAILALYKKGIITGSGDGRFEPQREITREELATMAVKAVGKLNFAAKCDFSDVTPDSWYYPFVASGVESGIIKGMSKKMFGSGTPVTRQDSAVMLFRMARLKGIELQPEREGMQFSDNEEISGYALESINTLWCCGVLNGRENNRFYPQATLTRAEAAKVIFELLIR